MSENKEMSFLQHLEALRWHLIRGVSAILIIGIIAFFFKHIVFDIIILGPSKPEFITNIWLSKLATFFGMPNLSINQQPIEMINMSMSGQFNTHIMISAIAGVILGFPYFLWEIWRFIRPALSSREIQKTKGVIAVVSALFFVGVAFGYFIIAPMSIDFLATYQVSPNVVNKFTLSSYISTLSSIVFSAGVMFELPVFIYFLARLGIVSSAFLKKYRRHAIVVIVIIAAIITPPDVFSQTLVSLPMLLLYEVSVGVARRMEKRVA